jgi:Arc/MetJ-type ribon-helix-helix transcriptional regulator
MATPRTRNTRVFTISFPEDLAKQVEETARKESRNVSELFREAFRTYQFDSFERKIRALRPTVAPNTPHVSQEDIESLVDEIRSDIYKKSQS